MSTDFDAAVAQSLQSDTAQSARVGFALASDTNPDAYAEAQRVARRTGVPVATALNMPAEMKRQARMGEIDFDSLAKTHPATANLLADVEKAKLAHDDVEGLTTIESALYSIGKYEVGGAKALASGAFFRVNEGVGGLLRAAGEVLPDEFSPLARFGADYARFHGKQADAMVPRGDGNLSSGFFSGMESLGMNLVTLPLGLAGKIAPVLTAMGALTGGKSYQQAREQKLGVGTSLAFGTTQGLIEAGTEMIGLPALFSILKPGQLGAKALEFMGKEMAGEQLATVLQDLNEWAVLPENKDKTFGDYIAARPDAAIQTAVATIVGGGGQIALLKGVERMANRGQQAVDLAEPTVELLGKLNELGAANKVLQRDPETFEQFIASAAESGPVSQVFVDANTLMQAGVAEQVAAVSPAVAEQLQTALQTGGQIAIPVEEYAARIAPTEYAQPLIDHLKVEPEGFSRAEAQQYMQSHADELRAEVERVLAEKEGDDTFKASAEAVKTEIRAQLDTAARFTPQVNDAYASMVSNFYAVQAAKLGLAPQELHQRYPLRVVAEAMTGPQFDQPAVAKITGAEIAPVGADIKTLRSAAKDWYNTNLRGTSVVHGETGKAVKFATATKALHSSADTKKLQLFAALRDIVAHGTIEKSEPERDPKRYPNVKAWHWLTATVSLDGAPVKVGVMLREDNQGNFYYNHNLAPEKAKALQSPELTDPNNKSGGGTEEGKTLAQSVAPAADDINLHILADGRALNQSKTEPRDLVITHNLTAANLLHAQKMGGIPVPSLAVTKKDTPLSGFGEITLIGSKEMADPKGYAGTKVFGADIYSPRYPDITYKLDTKSQKKLSGLLDKYSDRTGVKYFDLDTIERNGPRGLQDDPRVMAAFLDSKGIQFGTARREVRPLPDALLPFANDTRFSHDLVADPAFIEAVWQAHTDELAQAYDGDRSAAEAEVAQERARAEQKGVSYLVRSKARDIESYQRDVRDAGQVDTMQTKANMNTAIEQNDLGREFEAFTKDLLASIDPKEKIFQGFTNSGNRRYIDHTLDNVVNILKKELRGGENFNYGVGSLRAKFTPQFKSIEQIRKSKDRLIGKVEFERVKDEIDNEFWDVAQAIDKDLSSETAIAIMEDAAKLGVKRAAKNYGFDVSDDASAKVAEFLTKLRNLPTEYFEAKILRDVDLAEFSGAVVPEGVNPKVIEALQARGVKDIRTYKKGDEADRAAKVGEFENLFFQNKGTNRGAFNPATLQISLLKAADLSTFLHESGHFFLEVQADIAAQLQQQATMFGTDALKPGEQQMLADMQALLDWFGVKDLNEWHALDFEEKRAYHEQFARGFEAYLFEGKAPSIELQGLFQRFRAWLLNVYRDLKALNVELNDQVRGVFDRMLASNEQIQLAEQGRSMMPLFTSADQAGMTPEEFAAYQSLGIEATAEAIDDLQSKGLRDMRWIHSARGRLIKQLQKEAAAQRAEVQMDVRREVMSQPIYRAWQFLTGKLTAEDKVENPKPPKTDPNVLDETMDSLFVAIAKLGGLNKAETLGTWGVDPADKPQSGVFGKPVWRVDGGLSLDGMREALAQYGYTYETLADFEAAFDSELRGSPVYSSNYAPEQFQNVRPGDQVANPAALTAGRLDLGALDDMGLPAELVNHLKALRMTAKEGLHPDLVAEMFGFSSGDELVRRIAASDDPKTEIEGLTDAAMLERHGELSSPDAIERAADKAIHNEARARFVSTEANALAKATGQRKVLASAAREFARAMIDRLKVRAVRPGQYASAEVRAAKAAEKASKAGDLATAAAEKRNQLIQNYATRAAYDAQDEVNKGLRYLKKFEGDVKGLDADYADQIGALLERFDLRKGQSLKAIDKRATLAEWLKTQREAGLEPDIPADLENEAYRKSFKDMTVEEFRGLVDSVKQIEHLGRLKHKLLTAKDQRAYEAIRDDIVASIRANSQDREADTRTPTTNMGRALQGLKRFWASHIKAATWARVMDGGKDGGPMWEYFVRAANERGDQETTMRAEATAKLSEILAPVFALGKMGGKGQFFAGLNRSLNREARIAIALNTGNAGNLQRLLGGEGWNEAQILPVLQSLTAAEWRAVQAVWDHFESYRPQIAEKERRIYGKEPAWVDPVPFTIKTADGQEVSLRGGYYPIKYDPAASQRAEEHADAEGAQRQLRGAYTTATTRRSFTKARVEEITGRPLLYTLSGLYSGVNDVIHDLAWHEWLIDTNRLLRSQSIDAAIREHYGPEAKQQFKTWAADIAEGDKGADAAVDMALSRLRQGISASGLGFNAMSAAIQITGFNQSIVRIGATWVGRGVVKYLANPVRLTRQVNEMSDFMANRARTRFRELNELRNRVQDQSAFREFIGQYAYFMMMRMQQIVDVPTWWGAYEKAIAEGNDETRARDLADQAVIDAQGGGQTKDLSAIERGGPAQRLFTVFYSFMNTAFNLGAAQTMSADTPAKKAKLAVDYLMLYTVPAVLGYAIKAALTPGDSGDDDPDKIAKKLLAAQIDYLMGLMVVVREFGEAAKTLTGANDIGRDYTGPAGLRLVSDMVALSKQAAQGEFDTAFRKAAVNVIGDTMGLPSAQINRTITGTEALAEGETDNPAAVVFGFQKPR